MKYYLTFILMAIAITIYGQHKGSSPVTYDTTLLNKKFKIKLKTVNEGKVKGYLYAVTDSTVMLSEVPVVYSLKPSDSGKLRAIGLSKIASASIRPNCSVGRGALTGALVGAGVGIPLGLLAASFDESFKTWGTTTKSSGGEFGVFAGTLLVSSATFALFGGVLGSLNNTTFRIKGHPKEFKKMRSELEKSVMKITKVRPTI